jgi:hypothetical protein
MPTVLLVRAFRFFFYSNENNEPIHVHVTKGNADGKIWLEPGVEIVYMHGFTNAEQRDIMEIILVNLEQFKNKWHEYFDQ